MVVAHSSGAPRCSPTRARTRSTASCRRRRRPAPRPGTRCASRCARSARAPSRSASGNRRPRQGVLHLAEPHRARSGEHLVRVVGVLPVAVDPGREPVDLRGQRAARRAEPGTSARARRSTSRAPRPSCRRPTPDAAAGVAGQARVALRHHAVGVRPPVELEVVDGSTRAAREVVEHLVESARDARPPCSRNAGTHCSVTSTRMPSAPSPSRTAGSSSAFSLVADRAARCRRRSPARRRRSARRGRGSRRRCRACRCAVAPAMVCRSMSPMFSSARPNGSSSAGSW